MLKNRVLTAMILAPLAIAAILFLPDLWFALLWGVAIAVCAWEWSSLAGLSTVPARAGFLTVCVGVMTSYQQWAGEIEEWLAWPVVIWWFVLSFLLREIPGKLLSIKYPMGIKLFVGLFVLVSSWVLMVWTQHNLGPTQLLYLFLLVWVADIVAYFVGKRWGITKLAPEISPGKTAEGLYGALVAAVIFSLVVAVALYLVESGSFMPLCRWWVNNDAGRCGIFQPGSGSFATFSWTQLAYFALLSAVTVLFSVVGDLFESLAKRVSGVKDSGSILPGHGGLLDRLDSLIAAVSVYYAGSKLLEIFFR